ncbi:DUF3558 family protein [Actinopolyspora xinjiangensis]|uniref:DUF3558 family protein n=1 Tax=Actinopolyspora xinjiangensis TaxID=405564 RepID=UPI001FCD129A|nr:DUF3558 family protein [Actinopolyspora xinjiangensis]
MKLWTRSLLTAVAGAALIAASACSPSEGTGDGSSETSGNSPSSEALASVKPCEMLSSDTLSSFGLEVPGKTKSELPWKPGCYYEGDPFTVRMEKNTRQTVDSSEQKSVWAEFERLEVNGRSGARVITKGATQTRACGVMFDAGEGIVQVRAREIRLPDDEDECAEALKIAKKIEPNVPEPA